MTEDAFEFAEDAIRFCSLLDATFLDHGERDAGSGRPVPPIEAEQAWNTAAFRGELVALDDVHLWAGVVAPMAFDRRRGIQVTGCADFAHSVTPGGATQVLVHTADLGSLDLRHPRLLPRVRRFH